MRKIFFDANILVDLINSGNRNHRTVLFLFDQLVKQRRKLFVSPTSFAITYYFLSKNYKDLEKLNRLVIDFFSNFVVTREDNLTMEKVFTSGFTDLEDALQYYSALDAGVDAIITYNKTDFVTSEIQVYHPIQFINEFLL